MKLFYRHFGNGQPIIILHGVLGMSDNWVTLAKQLASEYSVYLPDLRNHGQSPHSRNFNYQVMADDLREFKEEHQLVEPVIIGHSMGGKVAMLFALQNPEMLKSLIVVDISPVAYDNHDYHYKIISAMMSVNLRAIHSREEVNDILSQAISDEATRLFIMKNLHRKAAHSFEWRLDLHSIAENLPQIIGGIQSDDVFEKPTLFIKGAQSGYILEEHQKRMSQLFPSHKLITINGAGHWLHAEKPAETLRAIKDFLTSMG